VSWPADNRPRYILVDTRGFLVPTTGGHPLDEAAPNRTYAILDRAFCHRTVFTLRSEQTGKQLSREAGIAQALAAAEKRLAELNAQQVPS
jgi:hypothetical protein